MSYNQYSTYIYKNTENLFSQPIASNKFKLIDVSGNPITQTIIPPSSVINSLDTKEDGQQYIHVKVDLDFDTFYENKENVLYTKIIDSDVTYDNGNIMDLDNPYYSFGTYNGETDQEFLNFMEANHPTGTNDNLTIDKPNLEANIEIIYENTMFDKKFYKQIHNIRLKDHDKSYLFCFNKVGDKILKDSNSFIQSISSYPGLWEISETTFNTGGNRSHTKAYKSNVWLEYNIPNGQNLLDYLKFKLGGSEEIYLFYDLRITYYIVDNLTIQNTSIGINDYFIEFDDFDEQGLHEVILTGNWTDTNFTKAKGISNKVLALHRTISESDSAMLGRFKSSTTTFGGVSVTDDLPRRVKSTQANGFFEFTDSESINNHFKITSGSDVVDKYQNKYVKIMKSKDNEQIMSRMIKLSDLSSFNKNTNGNNVIVQLSRLIPSGYIPSFDSSGNSRTNFKININNNTDTDQAINESQTENFFVTVEVIDDPTGTSHDDLPTPRFVTRSDKNLGYAGDNSSGVNGTISGNNFVKLRMINSV